MKFKWRKISVLIIILLFQNVLTIVIESQLTRNLQQDQKVVNEQYKNNWNLHHYYVKNVDEKGSPIFQNEELKNDVNTNSTACSPSGPMDSPWPMQSHDIYHTGLSFYNTTSNNGLEKWRVRSDYDAEIRSSAIIDKDNIIYYGTTSTDHSLYALYQNGTRKWKFIPDGAIWSTPAIAEDGTLYFGTNDNHLYAISSTGILKWTFSTGSGNYIESSPAIGSDGTIYVGCDNNNIYALYPNGTQKWHFTTGWYVSSSPAVGNDGTIYVGSGDYCLYALNSNGTLRWRYDTGGYVQGNPSIANDGTIYAPSFDGYLYALYPNGTMKWKVTTGPTIAAAGTAFGPDGTIYVGTEILRAYYPNGTLKWGNDFHAEMWGTVPAVSADGTILISGGGYLVAVNPNGTERWRCSIDGGYDYSSPCIGVDGTIYVGSIKYFNNFPYTYLHAIGPGELKRIEIQNPKPGRLYFFGQNMGLTSKNKTVIIGSVKIQVHAFSENQIDSIHFYVDGVDQYNVTAPPFEWNMNHRYGKWPLMKHTITVTASFKGGCSWTDSIPVWYFHLLKF